MLWRYQSDAVCAGQWWRVLSAHFVHVGSTHLLFNLLGLWLIAELLWYRLTVMHAIGVFLVAAISIVGMLAWEHPEIGWYAGLSGVLHGLWAVCAMDAALLRLAPYAAPRSVQAINPDRTANGRGDFTPMWIGMAAIVLLWMKLYGEFVHGPSASTVRHIGAAVVIDAHRYGAIAGFAYWFSMLTVSSIRRLWQPVPEVD